MVSKQKILIVDDDNNIAELISLYPVSYTHLDVYKRQRLYLTCIMVKSSVMQSVTEPITVR